MIWQTRNFGAIYKPIKYSVIWCWAYRGMWGEEQIAKLFVRSRHMNYTSTSCQNTSASAHCKRKAADCDNRATLDGHVLTGSITGDEQKDTHSPVFFSAKKHPNWLTCQGWYVHPEGWNREPSNFSLLKPATQLLQFIFKKVAKDNLYLHWCTQYNSSYHEGKISAHLNTLIAI